MVISSIYWTLLLLFPVLIIQPSQPGSSPPSSSAELGLVRIPLWIDLALHAMPALALVVDFMLFEVKYSRKAVVLNAPIATSLFAVWYSCWVEHCAKINGTCTFPVHYVIK